MPIVANTSLSTRKANATMANAFFRRAKKWIYPHCCGTVMTKSAVEPYVVGGSFPQSRQFKGSVRSAGLPSWIQNVPNQLYKAFLEIDRSEFEFDQTLTLVRKAEEAGISIAEIPDQLFIRRLITGSTTGSATTIFRGSSYNLTLDGLSYFNTAHTTYSASTQSNILQGHLPNTVAGVSGQDAATTAGQMQQDLMTVINAVQTVLDNNGLPIYPNLDLGENVVVVVPPILLYAAMLAFKATGSIIGGSGASGGSQGSSTNIAPMFVKNVVSSGYMVGFPDPDDDTVSLVSPTNPTDCYYLITDDRVKPMYVQLFAPAGPSDVFGEGSGYNIAGEVDKMLAEADMLGLKRGRDETTVYAGTMVEHNLNAVGSMAQRDTVEREKFFIATRSRMNIAYGPWFTGWRVKPVSGS